MPKAPENDNLTDYQYNPEGLTAAADTLARIAAILALRSDDAGDRNGGTESRPVRRSRLTPAYVGALKGELRLLRAQLYSTGLFDSIGNVDLEGQP